MRYSNFLLLFVLVSFLSSCKNEPKQNQQDMNETQVLNVNEKLLSQENFKKEIDGKPVDLYWLEAKDIKLAITNYGGRFVGLWVPDSKGKMTDVVVGCASLDEFINSTEPYFGATIGRVGNRIANGKFSLGENDYQVPTNNGKNSLHGGDVGFQYVIWDVLNRTDNSITLQYVSKDGEQGFPGELTSTVTYTVDDNQKVHMTYKATTDKQTVVNLTNHAFFNLNGEGSGTILNHEVVIHADQFTPVDETLIPTGELRAVTKTPFDFNSPHTIGERIETENEQLKFGVGYDHNFVLKGKNETLKTAAVVTGDKSGIVMTIETEEPGLQFYSGNFMQSKNTFKSGVKDDFRTAFAMETQHFPDAPNQPNFPSIVLEPETTYKTYSVYSFSTK